ncbi:MAG TPA: site-2 protease family protein [Clostridia bacterium]|nr:site-2 protease family protein [Clostridia bacterium]
MDLLNKFLYYLNLNFGISLLLYSLPGIILAFTIHEYSHALAAYMMGDKTAKQYGRLTLNPIAHIDPLGFLCLIVTRQFGWAKPVPVNDLNFRDRKKGMLLVSLAGPASNFFAALFIAIVYAMFYDSFGKAMVSILQFAYIINRSIGVFNLIPIPPLDGSKILDVFLTNKQKFFMRRYAIYSNIIIIMLVFSGIIGKILGPVIGALDWFINIIVGLFI